MITSFVQYILLAPSYINVLNVYAVCTRDFAVQVQPAHFYELSSQTYSMLKTLEEAFRSH
jgi:cellulose synthase/poly-beta-1,6-N-acetylglucosamine synthase-like glycosyltransferase